MNASSPSCSQTRRRKEEIMGGKKIGRIGKVKCSSHTIHTPAILILHQMHLQMHRQKENQGAPQAFLQLPTPSGAIEASKASRQSCKPLQDFLLRKVTKNRFSTLRCLFAACKAPQRGDLLRLRWLPRAFSTSPARARRQGGPLQKQQPHMRPRPSVAHPCRAPPTTRCRPMRVAELPTAGRILACSCGSRGNAGTAAASRLGGRTSG